MADARARARRVLLVNPRFNGDSFWAYKPACLLVGAQYPAPSLGLLTVAAMLPAHWEIRYFDRNVVDSEAEFDRLLGWADLMLSSGMLPQQIDHFRVIEQAKALNLLTVVGGPDASSSPHLRRPVWRLLAYVLRRNPRALQAALIMAAFYAHLGPYARLVIDRMDKSIAEAEAAPMREAAQTGQKGWASSTANPEKEPARSGAL